MNFTCLIYKFYVFLFILLQIYQVQALYFIKEPNEMPDNGGKSRFYSVLFRQ